MVPWRGSVKWSGRWPNCRDLYRFMRASVRAGKVSCLEVDRNLVASKNENVAMKFS